MKASPAARKLARELGIDLSSLAIEGSSKIIQINDVMGASPQPKPAPRAAQAGAERGFAVPRAFPVDGEDSHVLEPAVFEKPPRAQAAEPKAFAPAPKAPAPEAARARPGRARPMPRSSPASFLKKSAPPPVEPDADAAPDALFDYNYVKDRPSFENMLDAVEQKSRASAQGDGIADLFRFKDLTAEPEIGDDEKMSFANTLSQQLIGKVDSLLEDELAFKGGEGEDAPRKAPQPKAAPAKGDVPDLILAEEDAYLPEAVIASEASPSEEAEMAESAAFKLRKEPGGMADLPYFGPSQPVVASAFNQMEAQGEPRSQLPMAAQRQAPQPAPFTFDRSILYDEAPDMFMAPAHQTAVSQISSKILVQDSSIMKLLQKLKIGYRLGIVKVAIKACSYALEKLNFALCDRVAVINTESDFDSYAVSGVRSTPVQQLNFTEVLDANAMSGILLTLWDLTSTGLESFTATNLEGVNIFLHHNDETLRLEMETSDQVMDSYKAIQFMACLKEYLEKPSKFL